jgi:hypothetical protein
MRAKLKALYVDAIEDFDTYSPEDAIAFSFLLRAMIGPEGQEGEESFDMEVCTPEWLRKNYSETDTLFGRHLLIVFDFDRKIIRKKIEDYCSHCVIANDDWPALAEKLGRIGFWEFEDYTPYKDPS